MRIYAVWPNKELSINLVYKKFNNHIEGGTRSINSTQIGGQQTARFISYYTHTHRNIKFDIFILYVYEEKEHGGFFLKYNSLKHIANKQWQ